MAGKKRKTQNAKRKSLRKKFEKAGISKLLFKLLLVGGALVFSGIVLYSFFLPKNRFQQTREKALKNPADLETRLALIKIYLQNNQFEEAERELVKLQSFRTAEFQSNRIARLWGEKRANDPKEIEKEISSWEALVTQHPDYRDGYLQLAFLYLKLGETSKGESFFGKAKELSPNSKIVKIFEEVFFEKN
jgi:tetratricopeptide (TPR) repeat protein